MGRKDTNIERPAHAGAYSKCATIRKIMECEIFDSQASCFFGMPGNADEVEISETAVIVIWAANAGEEQTVLIQNKGAVIDREPINDRRARLVPVGRCWVLPVETCTI
jgi:hypothetical protein